MHKGFSTLVCGISALLLSLSCNQPFDANGPVDQHLVVFAILSTDRSTQFVRVTAPFQAIAFDPSGKYSSDNSVTNASVDIRTQPYYELGHYSNPNYAYYVPGRLISLRDTVLVRDDLNGNGLPLHVYATTGFTPEHGKLYGVYVASPAHGLASGSVRLPTKPTISIPWSSIDVVNHPPSYEPSASINFVLTLADSLKGYVSRLYLDYEVVQAGEWVSARVEVPISSADPASYTLASPIYPAITQCLATNNLRVTYKNGYLRSVIRQLADVVHGSEKIVFDRVVFMVLQVDPNLYSYYSTTQLERDPRSIRLDQPPVTRLAGGGYGVIGGYTLDSLVYPLSENFYANRR